MTFIASYMLATVASSTWEAGVDLSIPTRLQTSSAYWPPRFTDVARVLTQSESDDLKDVRKSSSDDSVGSNLVFGIRYGSPGRVFLSFHVFWMRQFRIVPSLTSRTLPPPNISKISL